MHFFLVANNLKSLLPRLGLSGVNILSAAPWIRRGGRGEGCQIDLLVQTESSAYVRRKSSKNVEKTGILREFILRKVAQI